MDNLEQYGFLGPIVGIAGLLVAAGAAIMFGWTRSFDAWKPPPDVLPEPLSRMLTLLCALGVFAAYLLAEPANQALYLRAIAWLTGASVVAFLAYVGLRSYCAFRRPLVGGDNKPAGEEVIWGGFWKTPRARQAVKRGSSVQTFLAGNGYSKEAVWPPLSLVAAAVVTAVVLLSALVCGTTALSSASVTLQVALTNKPARAIVGVDQVPGLPSRKTDSQKQ